MFRACPSGPDPRTCLRDPISGLAWENLGITPVELLEASGERNVCSDLPVTFTEPLVNLNSQTVKKRKIKRNNKKSSFLQINSLK